MPSSRSIIIVTPYAADANNGNWRTAQRWARLLSSSFDPILQAGDEPPPHDDAAALIALHARRSADAVDAWRKAHPDRATIVALTGTDLYGDLARGEPTSRRSLEIADRLVVLQDDAARHLPEAFAHKADVVYQSARRLRTIVDKPRDRLDCVFVGHLRKEKDPRTLLAAWRKVPRTLPATLTIIGNALDPPLGDEAHVLAQEDSRVRVLGARPHAWTRQAIRRAHLLLVPSIIEGGANVIVEALTCGTPVIASRVSGNVGMLGHDYPGYFEGGDSARLSEAIVSAYRDPAVLESLREAAAPLAGRHAPAAERRSLVACIARARDAAAGRMAATPSRPRIA